MELKNAVAVCLISLVAASLVVLIARSFDDRAAARLEPKLEEITQELRAIRQQGGMAAVGKPKQYDSPGHELVVYYFHGNIRCPTCQAIETQTHEVVENDFAEQCENGEITWKVLNYEDEESADLVREFGVHMANVVLARMSEDKRLNWRRLDRVWALVGDKPAFAEFMRAEIREMLSEQDVATEVSPEVPDSIDLPLPELSPPPLPQTEDTVELPLPK